MSKDITLVKPLHPEREVSDLDMTKELFEYLQDNLKLTPKKAFNVIYYLQEFLPVIPDHIEKCWAWAEAYRKLTSK